MDSPIEELIKIHPPNTYALNRKINRQNSEIKNIHMKIGKNSEL